MAKNTIVVGEDNSEMWDVYVGRKCEVLKDFFYNGETWYKLKDTNTGEIFESPTVFWSEHN